MTKDDNHIHRNKDPSNGQRVQEVGLSSAQYSLAKFTRCAHLGTGVRNFIGNLHTGDPIQDRLHYAIPDQAMKFLQCFQKMIKEGNIFEFNNL